MFLDQLQELEANLENAEFRQSWREIKQHNKERLAAYIREETGESFVSLLQKHRIDACRRLLAAGGQPDRDRAIRPPVGLDDGREVGRLQQQRVGSGRGGVGPGRGLGLDADDGIRLLSRWSGI